MYHFLSITMNPTKHSHCCEIWKFWFSIPLVFSSIRGPFLHFQLFASFFHLPLGPQCSPTLVGWPSCWLAVTNPPLKWCTVLLRMVTPVSQALSSPSILRCLFLTWESGRNQPRCTIRPFLFLPQELLAFLFIITSSQINWDICVCVCVCPRERERLVKKVIVIYRQYCFIWATTVVLFHLKLHKNALS